MSGQSAHGCVGHVRLRQLRFLLHWSSWSEARNRWSRVHGAGEVVRGREVSQELPDRGHVRSGLLHAMSPQVQGGGSSWGDNRVRQNQNTVRGQPVRGGQGGWVHMAHYGSSPRYWGCLCVRAQKEGEVKERGSQPALPGGGAPPGQASREEGSAETLMERAAWSFSLRPYLNRSSPYLAAD